MITQQQVSELFDYRDGGLYWKAKASRKVRIGDRAGDWHHSGYRRIGIDRKRYMEHRLVYLMHHGHLPEYLDHINGDTTDNRIENLRPCSAQQNSFNMKTPNTNKSGVKGVSWQKQHRCWQARLAINGLYKHLGYFSTIAAAKEVVDAARMQYHGAFARAA